MIWSCSMASGPKGSFPVICPRLQAFCFLQQNNDPKHTSRSFSGQLQEKPKEDFRVAMKKVLGTIRIFSGKVEKSLEVPAVTEVREDEDVTWQEAFLWTLALPLR